MNARWFRILSRRTSGSLAAVLLTATVVSFVLTQPLANACTGTPPPPECGKTVALMKASPGVVLTSASGTLVPVSVYIDQIAPAPSFGGADICPAPVDLVVDLELWCNGVLVSTGSVQATNPSLGFNNGIVSLTFNSTPTPGLCLIQGTATVTYDDGSVVSGSGNTIVCFTVPFQETGLPPMTVDLMPGQPGEGEDEPTAFSLLEQAGWFDEILPVDELPGQIDGASEEALNAMLGRWMPGDQSIYYYKVENNTDEEITGRLYAASEVSSGMPEQSTPSTNPNIGVYATSAQSVDRPDLYIFPTEGFPELVCLPLTPNPTERSRGEAQSEPFVIGPGEFIYVPVLVRTNPGCGMGTCIEKTKVGLGLGSDTGNEYFACSGSALATDISVPPNESCQKPVSWGTCEVFDENDAFSTISADPEVLPNGWIGNCHMVQEVFVNNEVVEGPPLIQSSCRSYGSLENGLVFETVQQINPEFAELVTLDNIPLRFNVLHESYQPNGEVLSFEIIDEDDHTVTYKMHVRITGNSPSQPDVEVMVIHKVHLQATNADGETGIMKMDVSVGASYVDGFPKGFFADYSPQEPWVIDTWEGFAESVHDFDRNDGGNGGVARKALEGPIVNIGVVVHSEAYFYTKEFLDPVDSISASDGGEGLVDLSWSAVDGADSYFVYRTDDGNINNAEVIGIADETFFADVSAEPGVTYTYFARAVNDRGDGPVGATDEGSVFQDPVLAAFPAAVALDDSWYWLDWLGFFQNADYPWVFHEFHGYWFVAANEDGSIWVLDSALALGWMYTRADWYPWFWSIGKGGFVFYFAGTVNPRQFWDGSADEGFEVP